MESFLLRDRPFSVGRADRTVPLCGTCLYTSPMHAGHALSIDRRSVEHVPCRSVPGERRWPPLSNPGFPRVEARRWGVAGRCLKLGRVRRLKVWPPPFEVRPGHPEGNCGLGQGASLNPAALLLLVHLQVNQLARCSNRGCQRSQRRTLLLGPHAEVEHDVDTIPQRGQREPVSTASRTCPEAVMKAARCRKANHHKHPGGAAPTGLCRAQGLDKFLVGGHR